MADAAELGFDFRIRRYVVISASLAGGIVCMIMISNANNTNKFIIS